MLSLYRAAALSACALASPAWSQEPVLWQVCGTNDNEYVGSDLDGLADRDGDGIGELLVTVRASAPVSADRCEIRSGATGALLLTIAPGTSNILNAGRAGDLDGDAVEDLWMLPVLSSLCGTLQARSGSTGAVLWSYPTPGVFFCELLDLAPCGDWNGDGSNDLALGYASERRVEILSGADGTILERIESPFQNDSFGSIVEAAGDLDGDGIGDLIVGSRDLVPFGSSTAWARALSGASHATLWTYVAPIDGFMWGAALESCGDVSGDGVRDFAVHSDQFLLSILPELVEWRSGADGSLLRETVFSANVVTSLGSLRAVGDVSGDGIEDLLASTHHGEPGLQLEQILSGADGLPLKTRFHSELLSIAPLHLEAGVGVGDVDLDGFADWVGSNDRADAPPASKAGCVELRRGGPASLRSTAAFIHHLVGGGATFSIDVGPAHAGDPYLLLATISGNTPGLDAGGVHVPLNDDALLQLGLGTPNQAPWSGSFGVLDAAGRASATITVPAIPDGSLNGTIISHAALVLGTPLVELATNEQMIALTN